MRLLLLLCLILLNLFDILVMLDCICKPFAIFLKISDPFFSSCSIFIECFLIKFPLYFFSLLFLICVLSLSVNHLQIIVIP